MDNEALTFWVIDDEDNRIALVVRGDYKPVSRIDFFTPQSFGQQLALMEHPSGHQIDAHTHLPVNRDLVGTQEVIVMRSGRLRVDLYKENRTYIRSVILQDQDVILLCGGGHGFEILEDAKFIEIKQGPYSPEGDKVRFDPTHSNNFVGL